MRLLKSKYLFVYWDEEVSVRFFDSDNPSKNVDFVLKHGNTTIKTWSVSTDDKGLLDAAFTPERQAFSNRLGKYVLSATCEGVTSTTNLYLEYTAVLIAQVLDVLLASLRDIPIYHELGKVKSSKLVDFGYKNWLYSDMGGNSVDPSFAKNGSTFLTLFSDLYPDYAGNVYLKEDLVAGDEIFADYHFSCFSEVELASAVRWGLGRMNLQPPITNYTINTAPNQYDTMISIEAYIMLMKRFLNDMQFWGSKLILADPEGARAVFQAQLTSAESQSREILDMKSRNEIQPLGVTGYKLTVPYLINQENYKMLTVANMASWR